MDKLTADPYKRFEREEDGDEKRRQLTAI